MSTKDFFWDVFQVTGSIGAYLVYKEFTQLNNPEENLILIEESQAN